jgi:hypothetical protein
MSSRMWKPLQLVQWATVEYPMQADCGTVFNPPVVVQQVAYPEPVAGVQLAVVMVRCNAGAGTPASAVYVYDGAPSASAPHLAATLITDSDGWQVAAFTAEGATVTVPVNGFSSSSVPNCCPDVHATLTWSWTSAGYHLDTPIPPHHAGA